MAYLGRSTDKISNIEILDNITFDGSSSYTLQKNSVNFTPSSANTLLLSIDGVVQAGNFTVSGSTIDFGVAIAGTSTCDFILHYGIGLITAPSDGTVTTAKLADSSVSLAKLTATGTKDSTTFLRGDNSFATIAGGLSEADSWRLTANTTSQGDLTSNWERADDTVFGKLGTGMTQSSGVFTFPSTGLYFINVFASFTGEFVSSYNFYILKTTHDNSTYVNDIHAESAHEGNVGNSCVSVSTLINVTDTSNRKFKFNWGAQSGSVEIEGNTDENRTGFTVIKLGDSV